MRGWNGVPRRSVRKCDCAAMRAGMSGLVAAYVAGRGGISEADATAWQQDLADLGDDYFFSLNRYLFVAQRS